MTNTEMIKEFCKTHDFRHQRDILTEQSSEMIMCLSSLGCKYYSAFTGRAAIECYAWMSTLVDLEILLTEMCIYCGEESIEQFLYHYEEEITKLQKSLMTNKDDIYVLANLSKAISKARRNDATINVAKAYEDFKLALYFALRRFVDSAKDTVYNNNHIEYYNKLYGSRVVDVVTRFKEDAI